LLEDVAGVAARIAGTAEAMAAAVSGATVTVAHVAMVGETAPVAPAMAPIGEAAPVVPAMALAGRTATGLSGPAATETSAVVAPVRGPGPQ